MSCLYNSLKGCALVQISWTLGNPALAHGGGGRRGGFRPRQQPAPLPTQSAGPHTHHVGSSAHVQAPRPPAKSHPLVFLSVGDVHISSRICLWEDGCGDETWVGPHAALGASRVRNSGSWGTGLWLQRGAVGMSSAHGLHVSWKVTRGKRAKAWPRDARDLLQGQLAHAMFSPPRISPSPKSCFPLSPHASLGLPFFFT